ncbi:MAG: CapA family protein [Anaerolineae bacterium]|nr:CapA family protein [Anaerolineae bacterium]
MQSRVRCSSSRRTWTGLLLLIVVLSACAPPTVNPTPTPTRTPHPTLTPTPSPTATPPPTPTPAFPVSVGCAEGVPAGACTRLQESVAAHPEHFVWLEGNGSTTLTLAAQADSGAPLQGRWIFALAAPFFTIEDDVDVLDLLSTWQGTPTGPFIEHPLLVTVATQAALSTLLGAPGPEGPRVTGMDTLFTEAAAQEGWAIMPFDQLNAQWKVLDIDGISLLARDAALDAYPLAIPLSLNSATRPETLPLLEFSADAFYNRNEDLMTIVAMTGVTAMTRAFASWMEQQGYTYAAEPIRDILITADFTHISNEVSFKPDCVPEPSGTMSFCSADGYIELLEYVGTDIVELTGNHLADKGLEPIRHSFDLYRERGWQWFGGGENLVDATRPLTITHGPNRLAFIGCNPIGPAYDWATEDSPGSAPCDYEAMKQTVTQLRDAGYLPIVTLQYLETEQYYPTAQQIRDFRAFADAGAVVMQGSQAHQVQTMEFYNDTFIHYGLGNLFFDQNWIEARPNFIDRLVFYDGRLLSVDLFPTTMEAYGRRRSMTPEEARPFLEMIYELSPQLP